MRVLVEERIRMWVSSIDRVKEVCVKVTNRSQAERESRRTKEESNWTVL